MTKFAQAASIIFTTRFAFVAAPISSSSSSLSNDHHKVLAVSVPKEGSKSKEKKLALSRALSKQSKSSFKEEENKKQEARRQKQGYVSLYHDCPNAAAQ
jgi:hypothetical protein